MSFVAIAVLLAGRPGLCLKKVHLPALPKKAIFTTDEH